MRRILRWLLILSVIVGVAWGLTGVPIRGKTAFGHARLWWKNTDPFQVVKDFFVSRYEDLFKEEPEKAQPKPKTRPKAKTALKKTPQRPKLEEVATAKRVAALEEATRVMEQALKPTTVATANARISTRAPVDAKLAAATRVEARAPVDAKLASATRVEARTPVEARLTNIQPIASPMRMAPAAAVTRETVELSANAKVANVPARPTPASPSDAAPVIATRTVASPLTAARTPAPTTKGAPVAKPRASADARDERSSAPATVPAARPFVGPAPARTRLDERLSAGQKKALDDLVKSRSTAR